MLVFGTSPKRVVASVTSIVLVTLFLFGYHGADWIPRTAKKHSNGAVTTLRPAKTQLTTTAKEDGGSRRVHEDMSATHIVAGSVSTKDGEYFFIDFGQEAINPNIIPHRTWNETWIVVAQQRSPQVEKSVWSAELVCNAVFKKGALQCVEPPIILPIPATFGDKCVGNGDSLDFFLWNVGPHDARVFYGPENPFTVYGSNGEFTCYGMFVQDFRLLVDWGFEMYDNKKLRRPVEMQRPPPYAKVEKNWFLFWDVDGKPYAHYDIAPKRSFAQLSADGSVGPDLAPHAYFNDETCMARYMPPVNSPDESIHQATNSLLVTTCMRGSLSCTPNEDNTFIMTIFQHKSFYFFHSVYEPYVMLFRQTAPFDVVAISKKPIWIRGRGYARKPKSFEGLTPEEEAVALKEFHQTEMFYITSIAWKQQGLKYHGYADDVVFINFGIEDQRTASIDVMVGDLLQDLGWCADDKPDW